jgi:hypothetical protein
MSLRHGVSEDHQITLLNIFANVAAADQRLRETLFSLDSVTRLLTFLSSPDARVPAEQFRFNNDALAAAMRALANLLEDSKTEEQVYPSSLPFWR